jgi:hypothetical protein
VRDAGFVIAFIVNEYYTFSVVVSLAAGALMCFYFLAQ